MTDAPSPRSRTYAWRDPRAGAAAGFRMSGLDYMRAIMAGQLSGAPIADTMGFRLTEVAEGKVTFVCEPGEYLYNPIGSVHGGVAATLIDSATGCAIHTTLPAGVPYTTVNLSVDYLKAMSDKSGALSCTGTVVRAGARIAVADAEVTGPDGTVYARGSATCLIMRPETKA